MSHNHSHSHTHIHHHGSENDTIGNLKLAFVLNLCFTIIEFIGGFWVNSIAILSDAVHDLGDVVGIGFSLFFEKYSNRPRSKTFSYGHKRFSIFAALINSLILLTGSIFILFEVVPRIFDPQEVNSSGMLLLAIGGIVFNGLAVLRLRKNKKSINQRAVMLHLMEDVLGWIAVLIGSIVIYFTGWYFIDPLLSILICAYILSNVVRNLYQIFRVLLQSVPEEISETVLESELRKIDLIKNVHDIHVWTMDGNYHIATFHVVVLGNPSNQQIADLRKIIQQKTHEMGIEHVTIEFEFDFEECIYGDC